MDIGHMTFMRDTQLGYSLKYISYTISGHVYYNRKSKNTKNFFIFCLIDEQNNNK